VAAALLIALAILVSGGALAGELALQRRVAAWREAMRLIAVLREPVPRPDAPDSLLAAVRGLPGVARAQYVAPDVALGQLRQMLGPRGEGLDRLPANPVPARIEITPDRALAAAELDALAAALARQPGVEEVQAALEWVEPTERVLRGVRLGGLALGALLSLAALAAVAGATRSARRASADEEAILRLAGVPELRLATPWVLQALSVAAAGALVGTAALLLGSEPGGPWTGDWLRTTLGLDPLPLLPARWLALLGGAGLTLGLLGALAAGRPAPR